MIKFKFGSVMRTFQTIGLAIFALSLGMSVSVLSSSTSQNQGKFFTKQQSSPMRPVPLEVIQIKTPQRIVQIDEGFLGSEDWFKNVELKIKNVSNEENRHRSITAGIRAVTGIYEMSGLRGSLS